MQYDKEVIKKIDKLYRHRLHTTYESYIISALNSRVLNDRDVTKYSKSDLDIFHSEYERVSKL